MKKLIIILVLTFMTSMMVKSQCPIHVSEFSFNFAIPLTNGDTLATFNGCDPDDEQTISWSINDQSGYLTIDNGVLKVVGADGMNADAASVYNITITATDNGTPELFASSNVTLNEINVAPIVPPTQSFSADEGVGIDYIVGIIDATDPNGDTLTFTISSANTYTKNLFYIDGNLIKTKANIDYEVYPSHTMIISVADNGATPLLVHTTVNISINNINEPPTITRD